MLGYTKFDFTVDEGKGRPNPSRDKKSRQAPQKEGGEKKRKEKKKKKKRKNSCVIFLLCDPGCCIHIDRCTLPSRIHEMTTKQTCSYLLTPMRIQCFHETL